MVAPYYPYDASLPPRTHTRAELEERARYIARSENRTEITALDRMRAERELRMASTES